MIPRFDIHKIFDCFDRNIWLKYIFDGSNDNKNKEVTYISGFYYKHDIDACMMKMYPSWVGRKGNYLILFAIVHVYKEQKVWTVLQ